MNWFKVEITKNKKIVTAALKLTGTKKEAINDMKKEYPNYTESNGYLYNAILKYDGH